MIKHIIFDMGGVIKISRIQGKSPPEVAFDEEYEKTVVIDKNIIKMINSLKKKYLIGFLTDVSPFHLRHNKKHGLYAYFDRVVTSLEAKQTKAEGKQKIYRLVLKKMGAMPEECVFIDDKEKNLAVPEKMGLKVIHYRNPEQLRARLKEIGVMI